MGNYTCNARNSLGSVKETIALRGKMIILLPMTFERPLKTEKIQESCLTVRILTSWPFFLSELVITTEPPVTESEESRNKNRVVKAFDQRNLYSRGGHTEWTR